MSMPTTVVFISGILLRLVELERKHGTMRAVGRVLKIDHGYLSRLKDGKKLNPSDAVLRKLGLRRIVQFSASKRSSMNPSPRTK